MTTKNIKDISDFFEQAYFNIEDGNRLKYGNVIDIGHIVPLLT